MQKPFPHRTCGLATVGLLLTTLVGCAGLTSQIVPCPLTYSEQEKEILAVAPKGTRRDDALRKLAAAGIDGSFGISRRVYYCELWNRPDGSRWHLNVALLFDEVGRLYMTRTADCDVTPLSDKSLPSSGGQSNEASPPAKSANVAPTTR